MQTGTEEVVSTLLALLKTLGRINENSRHGKIKQWLIPYQRMGRDGGRRG